MKIIIVAGIVIGIAMMIFYLRAAHPVKTALKGMLLGATALVLVNIFGSRINIDLPLSFFNTGVSLLLGIPGVGLLIAGQKLIV